MICLPEHRYWLPKPNKGTSNKPLSLPNTPKPNQSSTRKLKQWSIDKPNDRVVGCTFCPYGWLYFLSKLFSPQDLSIELSITSHATKMDRTQYSEVLHYLWKKHYSVHSYQFKTLRKWLNIILMYIQKHISLPSWSFYFRTMVLFLNCNILTHPFFPMEPSNSGVFPMNRWNISVIKWPLWIVICKGKSEITVLSPPPQDVFVQGFSGKVRNATGCDF